MALHNLSADSQIRAEEMSPLMDLIGRGVGLAGVDKQGRTPLILAVFTHFIGAFRSKDILFFWHRRCCLHQSWWNTFSLKID